MSPSRSPPHDDQTELILVHSLDLEGQAGPVQGTFMKIRAGFQIAYDCPQPTPMILQVSVHPTRQPDLITWDGLQTDPALPANTYHDSFGNFCHVITAPAGRLTLSTDF